MTAACEGHTVAVPGLDRLPAYRLTHAQAADRELPMLRSEEPVYLSGTASQTDPLPAAHEGKK